GGACASNDRRGRGHHCGQPPARGATARKVSRSLDRLQPGQFYIRPAGSPHPPRPDAQGHGASKANRRSDCPSHQNQFQLSSLACSRRRSSCPTVAGGGGSRPAPSRSLEVLLRVCVHRAKHKGVAPCRYRFPTFSSSAPVEAATSACRELPCESMVTMAGKSRASNTHMASGTPSSSSR